MSKSSSNDLNILASFGIKPLAKASNYREWRLAVMDILSEKDYLDIVCGKSKRPEEASTESNTATTTATASSSTTSATTAASAKKSAENAEALAKWETRCTKARSMLGRFLDSTHRELYAEVRDARELWQKLERRYAGKDQARIWLLRDELSKVDFHDDNLAEYTSSLEKLFNQLAAAGEVQAEKDKKYLLLSKLPSPYHPFRTITWNDSNYEDTPYDVICDRLLLEHQQLTRGDAETEGTNAFFAGKGVGKKRDNGKRPGAGRPQVDHSRSAERSVSKDSCFYCKEKGHWANKCPKKRQDNRRRSGNPNSNRRDRGQNQSAGSSATVNSSPQAWTAMDKTSAMIAEAK